MSGRVPRRSSEVALAVVMCAVIGACSVSRAQGTTTAERPQPGTSRPTSSVVSHHPVITRAPWGNDPRGLNLVVIPDASYRVRVVLAHDSVGSLETVSSMCRRTQGCIAGVNGDFFTASGVIGVSVDNCRALVTPKIPHTFVDLDTHALAEPYSWAATLTGSHGPAVQVGQLNCAVTGESTLFTLERSRPTPRDAMRTDLVLRGSPVLSATKVSQRLTVARVVRGGGVTPRRGEVVLSTTDHLSWPVGSTLTLRINATSGCDLVGGHPALVLHSQVAEFSPRDTVMLEPHPRTAIGWDKQGRTLLVTVDGTAGHPRATAPKLAQWLLDHGAVTAMNLDGGGSTVFFANNRVINSPADGAERPVAQALLVVPR